MLDKIKASLAGWSFAVLFKKLASRFAPVFIAGAVAFFSRWAPAGSADLDVQAAMGTVFWLILETARNVITYAITHKKTLEE